MEPSWISTGESLAKSSPRRGQLLCDADTLELRFFSEAYKRFLHVETAEWTTFTKEKEEMEHVFFEYLCSNLLCITYE